MIRRKYKNRNNKNVICFIADGVHTKIVSSKNPSRTIRTLQTGNCKILKFKYVFKLDEKYEKMFNKVFGEYKTIANNGWFLFKSEEWLHQKLLSIEGIDVPQALHLSKIASGEFTKVKTVASLIIRDVKRMLEDKDKVICYEGLVRKYKVNKKTISFHIKGAKLANDVFIHNKRIKN
jgi:hypothetical protein